MSNSDDSHPRRNNWTESFIDENLSIFQTRWLTRQTEALRQTRAELFDAILREWFAVHPAEVWKNMYEGEIVRRAVEDFISAHHEEFLPPPSREK